MIDFNKLYHLTDNIESFQSKEAAIQRWVSSTRELERNYIHSTIRLCQYFERIPPDFLSQYAIILGEILHDPESKYIEISGTLKDRILELATAMQNMEYFNTADLIRSGLELNIRTWAPVALRKFE